MRILVADDSRAVRRGLVNLLSLEKSWQVCGEVEDGASVLPKARELRPELVLLDMSMPGMNGLEAAAELRREFPQIKILILSQHDPAPLSAAAKIAGADACLDKARLATELIATIRKLQAA